MQNFIPLKSIAFLAVLLLAPYFHSTALAFDDSNSHFWSVCEYSDWFSDPCLNPYAGFEFYASLYDLDLDYGERLVIDMGDGTVIDGQSVTHIYETPGDYLMSFIVINDITTQQTTLFSKNIHVIPVVAGTAEVDMILTATDNTTITYDLELILTGGSPYWIIEGSECYMEVDYGDGSDKHSAYWVDYGGFFNMEAISHTFPGPGTYGVTLSVNCPAAHVPYPDPSSTIVKSITVGINDIEYEDLTAWETLNGIEVVSVGDDQYQLTHPGTAWPILRKTLPAISPGAQVKISFKGQSDPAGSRLQIKPWDLARTGGGHIYLTEEELSYSQTFTNLTGEIIAAPQLKFMFEDSSQSGIGQMMTIDQLRVEILTDEQRLIPTDDANNRATLDGLLAVSKWEHAFFRFDLAAVTDDVGTAVLRVYHYGSRIPLTMSVTAAETDDWSEGVSTPDLTYVHLQPDALIDSVNIQNTGYVELDVSEFIRSQIEGDGIASLELSTNLKTWTLLGSKEGDYPPELIIKTGESVDRVTRISVSTEGEEGNHNSTLLGHPGFSSSGRYAVFQSYASNLVENDLNDKTDVFMRDLETGETSRINTTIDGSEIQGASHISISGNGRYVTFSSDDNQLVENDTNSNIDIFVLDRSTNIVERVSVSTNGVEGNNSSYSSSISENGRYVMFNSYASTLVDNDFNDELDAFIHDRETDETTRICVSSEGEPANSSCRGSAMSSDGRYIVFDSWASNLVAGDTNDANDVFIHDRYTEVTSLISVSSEGVPGKRSSYSPDISKDGRFVTFASMSNDLVGDNENNISNIFVRDLETGTTTRISVSSSGEAGNLGSEAPGINDNGRYIVFTSRATNLVAPNTNYTLDIFVHDLITGKTVMVVANAVLPSISADGRQVLFASSNDYLVEDDFNNKTDVFIAPVVID